MTDLLLIPIDFVKQISAGEHRSLTVRFAIDFVLIPLRNSTWRVQVSDGQIRNGFCIDLLKEIASGEP